MVPILSTLLFVSFEPITHNPTTQLFIEWISSIKGYDNHSIEGIVANCF